MSVYLKNGNWFIDYRLPNGRRKREKVGTSKRLAENVLRKRKLAIAEGRFLDVKKSEKIRFKEFSQTFLELYSKPNKKSWITDFYNLKLLKSYFADNYLYQITPKHIEEFKAQRIKEVSAATVNRELAILKTALSKAVEWGKIEDNPAKNIKFLKENNKRLRYLEKEEIRRLIDNCPKRIKAIVIVAINTGMRRGEILKLKWHDIDFKQNIIHVLDTKNGESREAYMNTTVRKALIGTLKHLDSPYIFSKKDGKRLKDIRKPFFTALKKASIIDFRFHDLRHTFASQLIMAGIDLKTVQELMGHRDIRMTLRYSHLSADHKRRAVEVFDNKMDTFWTPEAKVSKVDELVGSKPIENK